MRKSRRLEERREKLEKKKKRHRSPTPGPRGRRTKKNEEAVETKKHETKKQEPPQKKHDTNLDNKHTITAQPSAPAEEEEWERLGWLRMNGSRFCIADWSAYKKRKALKKDDVFRYRDMDVAKVYDPDDDNEDENNSRKDVQFLNSTALLVKVDEPDKLLPLWMKRDSLTGRTLEIKIVLDENS